MRECNPWSEAEDAVLIACNAARITADRISPLLGRTRYAVFGRKRYLGLCFPPKPEPEVEPPQHVSVREIQTAVAEQFKVKPVEMTSTRRGAEVSLPRQVAMYLARELTPFSYPRIGHFFGRRDHTTVMYGVGKIDRLIREDDELRTQVEYLKAALVPKQGGSVVDKPHTPAFVAEAMSA